MVRPKVGATEGRGGVGSGGPAPGKFCKKTQNPAFWELLAHFWRSSGSRVEYSTQYDCISIPDLRVRV